MVPSQARGSEPRPGLSAHGCRRRAGSGGWLEADLVAEGFEFGDQAPGFPVRVQAAASQSEPRTRTSGIAHQPFRLGAGRGSRILLSWCSSGSSCHGVLPDPRPGQRRAVPGGARGCTAPVTSTTSGVAIGVEHVQVLPPAHPGRSRLGIRQPRRLPQGPLPPACHEMGRLPQPGREKESHRSGRPCPCW